MKNFKSIFEGISSQGKMMGSRGSSFRDSSSSGDQTSGLSIGASRAKDHEDATKDASIASEKNRKNEIEKRNKEAEQRQKETMQMSQEETVTEAKHVFHVHLHPIDTRLGKMVDDKTAEPIGNKPKGDKIKLTIPATDTRSARDKATRYAAKNFGVDNIKSIEYKGLHEANIGPNVDTKTIQGIHQRAHDSITNPDNKNLTYSHPGFADSIDNELKARKELAKRGIKVERPKHKAVIEATNTEKRENIENVARMDGAKPTSEKSTLGKTGPIKTKIVEEKPTMSLPNFGLSASLIAAARQIVEKKDDVKLTGGNTQVEVDPETNDRSESDEDTSTSKKKKKLDPVGKEDDDVDNDGDSDKSDSYLKNRRKAIGKAIKEDEQLDEEGRVKLGQVSAGPDVKKNVAALKSKHKDTHTDFIVRTRGPKEPSAGLYKNIKVSPQGGMKSKSATGFAVYGRPKVAKEEVELDELSKKTLGLYVKQASNIATAHSYTAGKTGDVDTAKKASKRIRGIAKATDKLITQGDFTSDELARIDEIAQSIFEIAAPGLDQNGKQKGINTDNDATNAVLSDEKKQKMIKK
jgi:hypothetical protein